MMLDHNIANSWMCDDPVEGVLFRLNDTIKVIAGPHAGAAGCVMSLIELEPEPIFLVETSDGTDVCVSQSDLPARDS